MNIYVFEDFSNINDPIIQQILSFKSLPEGWHYGDGRGAEQASIDSALKTYRAFLRRGIRRIEVFPDVDGGILLSGYHEDETLEILCSPAGSINVLHEVDEEIVYDEGCVSVDEATAYLRDLPWNLIGKSFDYFILDTTVGKRTDSRTWLSMFHQQTEEFLPLMRDVLNRTVAVNADISHRITEPTYLENRLYFGDFVSANFQIVPNFPVSLPEPVIPAT